MLNKIIILSMLTGLLFSCRPKDEVDLSFVLENWKAKLASINKIEYTVQRIDTFGNSNTVWNNTGYALIERDSNDKVFGFSFFGSRDDRSKDYLYDNTNGFEIYNDGESFEMQKVGYECIGKPGGQMIFPQIFSQDSLYKSIRLVDNKDTYRIQYEFENDTLYGRTEIIKIVELDRDSFLPVIVTQSFTQSENKSVHQLSLSNIKVNGEVKHSISQKKNVLKEYTLLTADNGVEDNPLIDQEFPAISLPDLLDNEMVHLKANKLTLLDFWEPWCGPCIKSLPAVEKLKNKYADRLRVLGITTDDEEDARRLVATNGLTFQNLLGGRKVTNDYKVRQYPTYFLIDSDGIIIKKYLGFNPDQIENDINDIKEL